ncbi:MAG: ATP synthase subunit I [Solimonas sp.]
MKVATRIARYQLLIAALGAVLWGVLQGWMAAASGFCGGLICAVLTYYTAVKALGMETSDPGVMITNFYRAESRKWVLAIVLFGFAAMVFKGVYAPLITTFAVAHIVYWFALLWK